MSAPARQPSRWGSLLQQALDGVESRLDNILVGDGPAGPTSVTASATVAQSQTGSPQHSNNQATNDRLQERLAKAIATKKNSTSRPDNSSSTPRVSSGTSSPVRTAEAPTQDIDFLYTGTITRSEAREEGDSTTGICTETTANGISTRTVAEVSPRLSSESKSSRMLRPSTDLSQASILPRNSIGAVENLTEVTLSQKSSEREILTKPPVEGDMPKSQHQQDILDYIERIDALHAKLQYLSRESAESARKAVNLASPSSFERKLAEKDEQIALLIEEGQRLSKTELKHMTIIKKLRAKAVGIDREVAEAKKVIQKSEEDNLALLEHLKRGENAEKQLIERQKTVSQLQNDLQDITTERDAKNLAIGELKDQLAELASQGTANEIRAAHDMLSIEKNRVKELDDELSSLKLEKELAIGRAKAQLDDLRSKHEREAERAQVVEIEMKAEQQMLESRLEVMRTRAEEVSSGATGDAQAKLLRQIETLQTQYAIASENWQGIEASLTSRVTVLQKERDDALKKEGEMKRKAREVTIKWNRKTEELEDVHSNIYDSKRELSETKEQLQKLQHHAESLEAAFAEARQAFEQDMRAVKSSMQQRIDEDKARWREDTRGHSLFGIGRVESPTPSSHRNLTADLLGLQNLQIRTPARSFTNELPITESLASQKSSGRFTPRNSAQFYGNGEVAGPISAHSVDHEDYFEHAQSPTLTYPTAQDVLSISTAGAGPSVQLVERMSAAVRRLEGEKSSAKEELRRLAAQRDEARAQIVQLLQDIDAKKTLGTRVKELEEENTKINARYQTTLEMLGEKSELVEELRADVQDVKDMYRELVERTVK